jgi:hypothetical protein
MRLDDSEPDLPRWKKILIITGWVCLVIAWLALVVAGSVYGFI